MVEDRTRRKDVSQRSNHNHARCHQCRFKRRFWCPPEFMSGRSALELQKQQVHCGRKRKIEEADSDPRSGEQRK